MLVNLVVSEEKLIYILVNFDMLGELMTISFMPKPKGTRGGNLSPVKTAEFLAHIKPRPSDLPDGVELAEKTLGVKVPKNIDALVRSLPSKAVWLREAIAEKLTREGLMQTKTVKSEAMDQENKDWLESDLSRLSELELYDWGDVDPETTGQPIRYEQGIGFVVEGGKNSGQ
jgi:hypothetical protein